MSSVEISSVDDAVNEARATLRACLPESDAWKQPNPFDAFAVLMGGMYWTAVNEARRGADLRLDPTMMQGSDLDRYAAGPKLGLTRMAATPAQGLVSITDASAPVPPGTIFTASDGTTYTTANGGVLVGDEVTLTVAATQAGFTTNSLPGRPLSYTGDGSAVSVGIYGGQDAECDEDLLLRIFAAERTDCYFGSPDSLTEVILGQPGVTRAVTYEDGYCVMIAVLMEQSFAPKGTPPQAALDELAAVFADECLAPAHFCPKIVPMEARTIAPEMTWQKPPEDICFVQQAMQDWMRQTFGFGDPVPGHFIQNWLDTEFGEYGPMLVECKGYPAFCGVYNCVELVGC